VFDMAGAVLTAISKDEHERAKALSRRKAETDLISNMLTERENGRKEGRLEGRLEGLTEAAKVIARKMKITGISYDEIILFTGLSIREIEEL
jgi:predicted transposase/invertase (TIGR01784 family)